MPLLPVDTGQVVTVATFFRVTSLIGAGRYSEVYAAFDMQSQSDVALKLYTGTDAASHALAQCEADVLSKLATLNSDYFPRLRHSVKHRLNNRPHPVLALELGAYYRADGSRDVVKLQDVIPDSNDTKNRGSRVDSEFWQERSVVQWIIHLFEAVRLLHEAGVIHRDIKPSNVLIKRAATKIEAQPLLLDYNSSPNGGSSQRGTPRYLPPEITQQSEAAPADDVWAAALVSWEMLHGIGSNPADKAPVGGWITGTISDEVLTVLRQALALDVDRRTRSAESMISGLESALGPAPATSQLLAVGASEFADAVAAQVTVRLAIEDVLAPPHLLVIPKDIEDSVHTLLLWLDQEETQALNLVGELVRLGPRAIPACLNQGHKLSPQSQAITKVVKALTELGQGDQPLAVRSIEFYSTSSNVSVRLLCRRLCESLGVFPTVMLNALHEDIEVLLPSERLELAKLCVRYSPSDKAGGTAVKFMCREYISNPDRYKDLKELALSMATLTHPKRAEVTEWYARTQKWHELREYAAVPAADRERVDRGLLELLADAFASMGDAAHQLVLTDRVGRFTDGQPRLPLFSKFVRKLGQLNEPTRRWLLDQAERHPEDVDVMKAAEGMRSRDRKEEDVRAAFEKYVGNNEDRHAWNTLRFSRDRKVFDLIAERLAATRSKAEFRSMVALLEGFENRQRAQVVDCVLRWWDLFERHDPSLGIGILSRYSIHDRRMRQAAVQTLDKLLAGPLSETARNGIDRLLAEM